MCRFEALRYGLIAFKSVLLFELNIWREQNLALSTSRIFCKFFKRLNQLFLSCNLSSSQFVAYQMEAMPF